MGGSRHEQSLTRTDYKVVGAWRGQVADKDEGGDYWREGEGKGPDPGPSPSEENVRQHQRARMLLLAGVHMIADLINTPILIKRGPTSCSHVQIISRRNMKWEETRVAISENVFACAGVVNRILWPQPTLHVHIPFYWKGSLSSCFERLILKDFWGSIFFYLKKKGIFYYLMSLHNEL